MNHRKTNWRASWTHGPDLPTELAALLALHNERRRIFMEAAQYAMSEEDIQTVLQHPDADDKKTYYHNLLTTSFRPLQTLLYKEARLSYILLIIII